MANYVIQKNQDIAGMTTSWYQEDFVTWTVDTNSRTVYTSKAKVDAAFAAVPPGGGFSQVGIVTTIKIS
tara:strand:- start:309 stop:515 length:207 start_codon:yes stop_codon:yes gene_type:complete